MNYHFTALQVATINKSLICFQVPLSNSDICVNQFKTNRHHIIKMYKGS